MTKHVTFPNHPTNWLILSTWDNLADKLVSPTMPAVGNPQEERAHVCGDPNDACDMLCLGNASKCHREGISGNCGEDCPVLMRGECDEKWELH